MNRLVLLLMLRLLLLGMGLGLVHLLRRHPLLRLLLKRERRGELLALRLRLMLRVDRTRGGLVAVSRLRHHDRKREALMMHLLLMRVLLLEEHLPLQVLLLLLELLLAQLLQLLQLVLLSWPGGGRIGERPRATERVQDRTAFHFSVTAHHPSPRRLGRTTERRRGGAEGGPPDRRRGWRS
jgi:hypothetical protein